jgi:NTE family protein
MTQRPAKTPPLLAHQHIALVLQGGGALGAYQAGVYAALADIPSEPHWVAGVSIGAINAALIAGNTPAQRVAKLREFWELISSRSSALMPMFDLQRSAFHQFGAAMAAITGVEGFYTPRMPPPAFQVEGTPGAISYYDTSPLRATLERLVDFDLINHAPSDKKSAKKVRLSVGAVNVRTGNSVYFDNTVQKITPEHIMASGALPPAFAPVEIDGEAYWDGGIVSNTPIQYVLDKRSTAKSSDKMLIAQVDLFNARGSLPVNMAGVQTRQKDIMFSSRTRFNTTQAAKLQRNKQAIINLIAKLPPALRRDPDVLRLEEVNHTTHVDIVHLIYRQSAFELESKDYDFSRSTMLEHWAAGQRDMQNTLAHPEWLTQSGGEDGVTVYDLAQR